MRTPQAIARTLKGTAARQSTIDRGPRADSIYGRDMIAGHALVYLESDVPVNG